MALQPGTPPQPAVPLQPKDQGPSALAVVLGPGRIRWPEPGKSVSTGSCRRKDPDDGGRVMEAAGQHGFHGVIQVDPVELDLGFFVRPLVAFVVRNLGEVSGQVDPDGLARGTR